MRRSLIYALLVILNAPVLTCAGPQDLLDRIVARVENDIILLSEIRALRRYQMFVEGKSETDAQILDRLIDQWIVRSEAETAHFPHPSDADITHGVEHLREAFASPEEYQARKNPAGLSDADIRNMLAAQLYLSKYLDSRFRAAVQIDPKEVEDFYQKAIIPRAKARNQAPPPLDVSRDYIQEALMQRGINEQADRWLKESRVRLRVDKFLNDGAK